jgi:hypothetical protein
MYSRYRPQSYTGSQQRQKNLQEQQKMKQNIRRKELENAAKAKSNKAKKQTAEKNKQFTNAKKILDDEIPNTVASLNINIDNIRKQSGSDSNKALKGIRDEVMKAIGAINKLISLSQHKNMNSNDIQKIQYRSNKYKKVISDLTRLTQIIDEIQKKFKMFNETMEKIEKTIGLMGSNNLTKEIIDKISQIKRAVLVDSGGTIRNYIGDLIKIVDKRLKQANMWVVPQKLRNIKNKEKGLLANIRKLEAVLANTNTDKIILQSIYTGLNQIIASANEIKKSSYNTTSSSTQLPTRYGMSRQAGGKKSFHITKGNLHKHLKVPKSYKFRKSSIERMSKIKTGNEFTFRTNKFKMTKLLKKEITLAKAFIKIRARD